MSLLKVMCGNLSYNSIFMGPILRIHINSVFSAELILQSFWIFGGKFAKRKIVVSTTSFMMQKTQNFQLISMFQTRFLAFFEKSSSIWRSFFDFLCLLMSFQPSKVLSQNFDYNIWTFKNINSALKLNFPAIVTQLKYQSQST